MLTEDAMDVAGTLTQLRKDPGAIPWNDRRKVVARVAELLAGEPPTESLVELVRVLADDPKWEVRKGVADLVGYLPDEDFARVCGRLADDCNAYVCRSVQRALKQRKQQSREADLKRRGLEQVEHKYAVMERRLGKPAAETARRIGRELHEHLVRGFIHDLRGALTPVKGNAAMLVKQCTTVQCRQRAERIVEQVEFCERLLENMKAYARRAPLELRRERLSEIVRDARRIVADLIADYDHSVRNVTLSVEVPEQIVLTAARQLIAVALANVIHNAFDAYMVRPDEFAEGQITLQATTANGQVIITIRDEGEGIHGETLTELRRFIPGTTSKPDHGTGYGLPLTHRYVDLHGGNLKIDSNENQGTIVTIMLPVEQT